MKILLTQKLVPVKVDSFSAQEVVNLPINACRELTAKEHIYSHKYKERQLFLSANMSFNKVFELNKKDAELSGRKAIPLMTLENMVVREGKNLSSSMMASADAVLTSYGFNPETLLLENDSEFPEQERPLSCPLNTIPNAKLSLLANEINKVLNLPEDQQVNPALHDNVPLSNKEVLYIEIDDIIVRKQKEHRKDSQPNSSSKWIGSTCATLRYDDYKIDFVSDNLTNAIKLVLAYLLVNKLMVGRHLMFIADGASSIAKAIKNTFGQFSEYTYVNCLWHVKHKLKELMSSAIKGDKQFKTEFMIQLGRYIKTGNSSNAIAFLQNLSKEHIKSGRARDNMIKYIQNKVNLNGMPCYFILEKQGIKVASTDVESTNDMFVACRQKEKKMAWSSDGSHSVSAIRMGFRHGVMDNFMKTHKVDIANIVPNQILNAA